MAGLERGVGQQAANFGHSTSGNALRIAVIRMMFDEPGSK
jgi:hypothetical protein